MVVRLLVPALVLALVGCIPTGSKCGKSCGESAEPASSSCEDGCCTDEAKSSCCTDETSRAAALTAVNLKAVKFDQLTEAIQSHKGKVVVVDLWASYCIPCKKEFPQLVSLHRTFAEQGVVCISVSVDEPEQQAEALAFLTKAGATFANYRLDEPNTVWQEKWDLNGIPAVFVFDRDGKRAAKFSYDDPDNQFSYEENVVPLVRKLSHVK